MVGSIFRFCKISIGDSESDCSLIYITNVGSETPLTDIYRNFKYSNHLGTQGSRGIIYVRPNSAVILYLKENAAGTAVDTIVIDTTELPSSLFNEIALVKTSEDDCVATFFVSCDDGMPSRFDMGTNGEWTFISQLQPASSLTGDQDKSYMLAGSTLKMESFSKVSANTFVI